MDFGNRVFSARLPDASDVYTNLQGLQNLKAEDNKTLALKKVAQQFESLFVSLMLKNMRAANSVFENGTLFDSQESKFYRDMLDHQRALTLSQGRGLGIADVLYRQLSKTYGIEQMDDGIDNNIEFKTEGGNIDTIPAARADHIENHFATPEDFIREIYPHAKQTAAKIGVDTETIIAQSALETGWGKHVIRDPVGHNSHNFFNIKAGSTWRGDTINKKVVEYHRGALTQENAKFRRYQNMSESFADYARFVLENPRYQNAVEVANDGKRYLQALSRSGFATDPNYVQKITDVRTGVVEKLRTLITELDVGNLRGTL